MRIRPAAANGNANGVVPDVHPAESPASESGLPNGDSKPLPGTKCIPTCGDLFALLEISSAGLLRSPWWSGSSGLHSQLWFTQHQTSSADPGNLNQQYVCASARTSSQPNMCGAAALCFKVEDGFKWTDLFEGPYWHAIMSLVTPGGCLPVSLALRCQQLDRARTVFPLCMSP